MAFFLYFIFSMKLFLQLIIIVFGVLLSFCSEKGSNVSILSPDKEQIFPPLEDTLLSGVMITEDNCDDFHRIRQAAWDSISNFQPFPYLITPSLMLNSSAINSQNKNNEVDSILSGGHFLGAKALPSKEEILERLFLQKSYLKKVYSIQQNDSILLPHIKWKHSQTNDSVFSSVISILPFQYQNVDRAMAIIVSCAQNWRNPQLGVAQFVLLGGKWRLESKAVLFYTLEALNCEMPDSSQFFLLNLKNTKPALALLDYKHKEAGHEGDAEYKYLTLFIQESKIWKIAMKYLVEQRSYPHKSLTHAFAADSKMTYKFIQNEHRFFISTKYLELENKCNLQFKTYQKDTMFLVQCAPN
jgi:hypothetical protein